MAPMLECNSKTLCFVNVGVEQGFLRARQSKLSRSAFLGLGLLLVFILANFVLFLIRGWSTGAQIFRASDEGLQLAEARSWIIGLIGLVCVIGMAISRSARLTASLGARGFEAFLMASACIIIVLTTLQHPWYLVRAFGSSSPELVISNTLDWTDDKLLLMLDVWLTGCHLLLPIRWVMLWPVEVAAVLSYVGAAVALGSHVDLARIAMNALLMSLLVLAAAWGKRALELHERSAFAQLAAERTLRFEAEHKLSEMTEAQRKQRELDAMSIPASAYTADLFDLHKDDSIGVQLEPIMTLGLREHWLIKPEAVQLLPNRVLGSGGFGMAAVALYHGTEVVVKAPRTSRDKVPARLLAAMADELRIFRRLHHPNIVMFYGACIDPGNSEITLVLEYIRGQELDSAIVGVPATPLAVGDRCRLADNMCAALSYLHAQRPAIIHGDIKSANVLVELLGTRRNAKLLDFGLSRLLTRRPRALGGTVRWMAPEVIKKDDDAVKPNADIFSLGRLVYMIMTGRMPLDGVGRDELIDAAYRGECLALEWPSEMPLLSEAQQLCEACCRVLAASRPDIGEVQASLRQWGTGPDVPDDLAAVLRKTYPEVSGSSDLREGLQKARATRTSSSTRTPPNTNNEAPPLIAGRPPPPERQAPKSDAPITQLIAPLFDETPHHTKMLTITYALSAWNIPIHAGACCTMHAMTQELQKITDKLKAQKCKHISILDGWQCPKCKLMGEGQCDMCESSDASTDVTSKNETQEQPLKTLPEALGAEDDGQRFGL